MSTTVYAFGNGRADGSAEMKALLGGKGANLAEMANLGLPVPAGFTISTEVCTYFSEHDRSYPPGLEELVDSALRRTQEIMGRTFGDPDDPLLVSVRSGARVSMPGMMETVLNIGLTTDTLPGLAARTGDERFAWDSYRRLITMYADVVMEKAAGIQPPEGQGIRQRLDQLLDDLKARRGYEFDYQLTPADLQQLTADYKAEIQAQLSAPFPDDPYEQLWGAVGAVFVSWNGKRAIAYRRIEGLSHEWGTAVNIQSMVYGNLGATSATGVAFSRHPATGENAFFGEWLPNAQGEDVVAGIRTPNPLNEASRNDGNTLPSLEQQFPALYAELLQHSRLLENHYTDMQDLEFTIEDGHLYMLQTRVGKRNGLAALRIAVELVSDGLIDQRTALTRVRPAQLDELLHPMVSPAAERNHKPIAEGLPAGPGAAVGKIVLSPDRAEELAAQGEKVILVRTETSPEDIHGMHAAEAILTSRGGMTSHAALVARGWGKCCIVGCQALIIHAEQGEVRIGSTVLREGDVITLNGTRGLVYQGELPLTAIDLGQNKILDTFLAWCDEVRRLGVRANADRPEDAAQARRLGAEGIGLTRTEHMFFEPERIKFVRQMILANSPADRRKAIMRLLPFQKDDFRGIFQAMDGLPVTIRLLDPPLHEFVPHEKIHQVALATEMGLTPEDIRARVEALEEFNPMLGHRGCRLGISYPEITEMQARAILEAAAELIQEGLDVRPEIMVPLVGHYKELRHQRAIITDVYEQVRADIGDIPHLAIGTMIEVPRGAITADEIAPLADFFSFGTNDLTQMGSGFSRDDSGSFLPRYLELEIYPSDPFQSLDQAGIGELVRIAVEKGRRVKPGLKMGICGEHGGDPDSIRFFHEVGLDYVSCSPFRIPVARLAAAQAALSEAEGDAAARDIMP
ncbi:MAG: pyruvate, phosphate dikinase [Candidatus Marinimicrobia bacterium]|nr:pyruvate, phosphate dikinase [Candidatus Neomarinimicrobiota bacterium]